MRSSDDDDDDDEEEEEDEDEGDEAYEARDGDDDDDDVVVTQRDVKAANIASLVNGTLETCARERGDGERRGWWWTRTRATSGEDAGDGGGLDATRANVAATLEKLRS